MKTEVGLHLFKSRLSSKEQSRKKRQFCFRSESITCKYNFDNISVYVELIQIMCSSFMQYLASRKRECIKVGEKLRDKPQALPRSAECAL